MLPTLLLLAGVMTFFGAVLQRASGMGFALIVAPVFVVLFGPAEGVILVNYCGALSATMVFLAVRRHVDWPMARGYLPWLVLGVGAGAIFTALMDESWLSLVAGGVLLVSVIASIVLPRRPTASLPSFGALAGAGSGFMNVTSGAGGPPIVLHGLRTGTHPRVVMATLQPIVILNCILSIGFKLPILWDPEAALAVLPFILAAPFLCGAGQLAGRWLSLLLDGRTLRIVLLSLSLTGASLVVYSALVALLAG